MKKSSFILILLIILGGAAFVSFSPKFERNAPQIDAGASMFWNGRSVLKIPIRDESLIRSVVVSYREAGSGAEFSRLAAHEPKQSEFLLEVKDLKQPRYGQRAKGYELLIEATDSSLWNYFLGNTARKQITVQLDLTPPSVNVLANSYHIERGGAAAVVFYAADENLRELYVQSGSHKFRASPYKKDGYFLSLLAWDVLDDAYSADIVATDAAGNTTRAHVPLYQRARRYKTSEITASESFVQGKIRDLFERYAEPGTAAEPAQMLDFVNAKLRTANEKLIHEITSHVSDELVTGFSLQPFLPLKNAAKVADFADHRYYLYKGARASESYHMGIDLASIKMAPIVLSNPGRLVFAQENGIYGLNLLVDHGLGLFTLYGHCSSVKAEVGVLLGAGTMLGQTGTSGLALGDHLHFGVLVQGVEVRPEEWLDRKWLNDNIFSVLKKAEASIK